jgi:hypothetical protein
MIASSLAALGCRGGSANPSLVSTDRADGGASPRLPECRLEEGRSWKFGSFRFRKGDDAARDYGDGVPRNALRFLATPEFDKIIKDQIDNGSVSFGMHIVGFTGDELPAALDDRAVETMTLVPTTGGDGAAPDGGTFCADPQQFTVDCKSWSGGENTSIDGGVITATGNPLLLVARNFGVGTIQLHHALIRIEKAETSPSWDAIQVTLQAVWPACSLASTIGPNSNSMLDYVTATHPPGQPEAIMPDFDLSTGKGLGASGDPTPVLRNEAGIVTACEMGDETIPGSRCACDPRFTFGYTMAMQLSGEKVALEALCDEP